MRSPARYLQSRFQFPLVAWLATVGLCFGFVPASYASGQCVPVPQSKRQWAPKNKAIPTNAEILKILSREAPSGEFEGVQLWYLGRVQLDKKKFYVVYTEYSFNHDTREIDSLVFFSEDWHYLGNYGEVYHPPVMICGNTLYWPYNPYLGNKVVVGKGGPPGKVVLNGEEYGLDDRKANSN